jgi:hypothetical protein
MIAFEQNLGLLPSGIGLFLRFEPGDADCTVMWQLDCESGSPARLMIGDSKLDSGHTFACLGRQRSFFTTAICDPVHLLCKHAPLYCTVPFTLFGLVSCSSDRQADVHFAAYRALLYSHLTLYSSQATL